MSQKILIKPSVSSKTYEFEKKDSKSYICDEDLKYHYELDGISSDVWNVIVSSEDYQTVYEYAKKHKIEDEIESFLQALQDCNLIVYNEEGKPKSTKKRQNLSLVNTKEEWSPVEKSFCLNINEYQEEKTQWIFKRHYLQELVIQTSYKCNLVCTHCYNEKHQNEYELSFENIKKIVDQAEKLGVMMVGITGGECTLHKDFLKICQYIRSKHLALNFLTNGIRLYDDEELFNEVVKLYPREIKISVYSMNPEIHDEMTGIKGSWKKTIEVIKKLREHNIGVTLNHLRVKKNFDSYDEILAFCKKYVVKLSASTMFIINKDNKNADLRLPEECLVNSYLDKDNPGSVYKRKLFVQREPNRAVCRATEIVLSIAPNMDVTPCNDFNYPIGNMNTDTLEDIWNVKVPEFREKFLNKYMVDCGKEEYCKYCEYCPLRAFQENGFLKKSTTSCENAKAFAEARKRINL